MIKTGLEILVESRLGLLKGKRTGFATHPPAVLPNLTHAVDVMLQAGVQLAALFGPEHGFDSSAADGAAVEHSIDRRTGLPVFSLYGDEKEPSPSMLADIDVILFDMQDVGVRFYTYLSTLYYVLRGAAKTGKPVIVLDRPNPLNGCKIAGPMIEPGFESFIGIASMPVRHGMTMGELARYFNSNFDFKADLTVIAMEGWQRRMWFDETGLPWVPLSPGMPQLSTAIVYAGMCFLEGTNLSEGRGTALPFEIAGAPWLDGYRLAQELNSLELPGVRFRPVHFIPSSSKHAGQPCQGVQVHVTNRETFDPILAGLHLIGACQRQAPDEFQFLESSWEGGKPHFDLLAGTDSLRQGLLAGEPVEDLVQTWSENLDRFQQVLQSVALYS